jgi:hypothetical protein
MPSNLLFNTLCSKKHKAQQNTKVNANVKFTQNRSNKKKCDYKRLKEEKPRGVEQFRHNQWLDRTSYKEEQQHKYYQPWQPPNPSNKLTSFLISALYSYYY